MTLATKLHDIQSKLDQAIASGTNLAPGTKADLLTAKIRVAGMATSVPQQLASFYGGFMQHVSTVNAMAKSLGTLTDNPTHSICGVIAFTASGDFLNGLTTAVDALLAKIKSGVLAVGSELSAALSALDKAVVFTAALHEIDTFLGQTRDALKDFAAAVGASGVKDLVNLTSCLVHAATFTTERATLLAHEVTSLRLNAKQAANLSFSHTGIKDISENFMAGMAARLHSMA